MITDNNSSDKNNVFRQNMNRVQDKINNTNYDDEDDSSSSEAFASTEQIRVVKQSIEMMQSWNLCVHPTHFHSFQKVTFFISGLRSTCVGCNQSLQTVMFGASSYNILSLSDGDASWDVVKCIACGVMAHRSCALATTTSGGGDSCWKGPMCSVNSTVISTAKKQQQLKEQEQKQQQQIQQTQQQQQEEKTQLKSVTLKNDAVEETNVFGRMFRYFSPTNHDAEPQNSNKNNDRGDDDSYCMGCLDDDIIDNNSESNAFSWTAQGPPRHWASTPENLVGLISRTNTDDEDDKKEMDDETAASPEKKTDKTINSPVVEQEMRQQEETKESKVQQDEEKEKDEEEDPLHYSDYPFANVSKALQENIFAHFQQAAIPEGSNGSLNPSENSEHQSLLEHDEMRNNQEQLLFNQQGKKKDEKDEDSIRHVKKAATQVKPPPDPPDSTKEVIRKVTKGTYQAVKKTQETRSRLGIASVAGGIAGGVAGLYMAGPAGAVLGCRYGQTAGALGLLIEGSVNVGVVVAGVISASSAALRIQDRLSESTRIITMGEDGTSRKLLLVRPNIKIDPIWKDVFVKAQNAYKTQFPDTSDSSCLSFIKHPGAETKSAAEVRQVRYHRVNDIVETQEEEIPTPDKVLILVSRLLNDKTSYPGFVYRYLIQAFRDRAHKDRCERWERQQELQQKQQLQQQQEKEKSSKHDNENSTDAPDTTGDANTATTTSPAPSRERRHDTHAVIKYVTASLLEVRPGFASSPIITELAATAVEGLVFGEVYDLVLEEIALEASDCDRTLLEKIQHFQAEENKKQKFDGTNNIITADAILDRSTSHRAVEALRLLPKAYSAVEKLGHCVQFLELVSEHFSTLMTIQLSLADGGSDNNKQEAPLLSADSLLKMVCQHIIVAKVPRINAEVQFIEEFARDEQLLKGKDGYALVTLQASLHFLNASNDFENDIFGQEDKEHDDDNDKKDEDDDRDLNGVNKDVND